MLNFSLEKGIIRIISHVNQKAIIELMATTPIHSLSNYATH